MEALRSGHETPFQKKKQPTKSKVFQWASLRFCQLGHEHRVCLPHFAWHQQLLGLQKCKEEFSSLKWYQRAKFLKAEDRKSWEINTNYILWYQGARHWQMECWPINLAQSTIQIGWWFCKLGKFQWWNIRRLEERKRNLEVLKPLYPCWSIYQ